VLGGLSAWPCHQHSPATDVSGRAGVQADTISGENHILYTINDEIKMSGITTSLTEIEIPVWYHYPTIEIEIACLV